MTKQHAHITVLKKYKSLLLHLFFVIYDQIISNLHTLSNYALSYIGSKGTIFDAVLCVTKTS